MFAAILKRMSGFIMFLSLSLACPAFTEYTASELPVLDSDFEVSVTIRDTNNAPLYSILDGKTVIRVDKSVEARKGNCGVSFYIDRMYIFEREKETLPYEFEWDFSGLSEREHELIFVVEDMNGLKGVFRMHVSVEH